MKRRFKPLVRYLPTTSFGMTASSTTAALVGAGNSNVALQSVLQDLGTQPADVVNSNSSMWDRELMFHDNIVKGLTGKFCWAINGKVSGQTVSSGIASVAVRGVIFSVPMSTKLNAGAPNAMQDAGTGQALSLLIPDIGSANYSYWALQSRVDTGIKVFWHGEWFANVDFGAQTQLNSESFAPPTTRVAVRAKRRLRWNEQLYAAVQYSVVNLNGLAGATQITLCTSLRVAASRVRARR